MNAVCVYNAATIYISGTCGYLYRVNMESATRGKRVYRLDEPALIADYLNHNMDLTAGSFTAQLRRSTVHKLFNRCVSQFHRLDSYKAIANDLNECLSNGFYKECIWGSDYKLFSYWKGFLAQFALRHRLYRLMQIYSRLG